MSVVTMKNLLEAGVHFGHQTTKWNPLMKRYIFMQRNGIHIVDLQKTMDAIREGYNLLHDVSKQGKKILFVGTKKQAHDSIEQEATRAGAYFVNNRWLGGTLTNFNTLKKSLKRYKEIVSMQESGGYDNLTKKEISLIERRIAKMHRNMEGFKDMDELPGAVFVIDSKKENLAVAEAHRCGVPVVAIVDTNSSPENIDVAIPGNDDAIRSVALFCHIAADAILEKDMENALEIVTTLEESDRRVPASPSSESQAETETEEAK